MSLKNRSFLTLLDFTPEEIALSALGEPATVQQIAFTAQGTYRLTCDAEATRALTRDYLAEHLPRAKFRISEATYLAWVDLGAYFAPEENLPLFFAYEAGVLLEGGNMFVQHSDGFIRLNLACPRSVLAEGLKRICEAVNTKHPRPYFAPPER